MRKLGGLGKGSLVIENRLGRKERKLKNGDSKWFYFLFWFKDRLELKLWKLWSGSFLGLMFWFFKGYVVGLWAF